MLHSVAGTEIADLCLGVDIHDPNHHFHHLAEGLQWLRLNYGWPEASSVQLW